MMRDVGTGLWRLGLGMVVIAVIAQVGQVAATATARRSGSTAADVATVAGSRVTVRTPTPTAPVPVDVLLTAVHDALGTPEPTAGPPGAATERPATPDTAVSLDNTFEDPDGFFALDYPEGWILSPRGGALLAPTGGGGLSMAIEIKAVTAETLIDRYTDWYANQVDNYIEVGRWTGTLSGYPAVWIEQAFSSGDVPHRGLMAATLRNRVGFVFTGWMPTTQPAPLKQTLRAMIESVRISEFEAAPPYNVWSTYRTPHLTFHYLPDTWIDDAIEDVAEQHETAFIDNVDYLEVDYTGPIDVYIYSSEESFYRATARDAGFAINAFSEVHTRWFAEDDHQTPGHEITHVITHHGIGEPAEALLGEGIAVWLDHGGNDYHQLCADLAQADRLVPLADLLGEGWDGSAAAYYEAGSFTGFLLERFGVDRYKAVYTAPDLPAAVRQAYRANLAALETKWLAALN